MCSFQPITWSMKGEFMSAVTFQVHDASRLRLWTLWIGRLLSVLPVLILLSSARWKLTHDPWYVREWGRIGYTESALGLIGLLQLACVTLYVIPPTAVLGAVLLTGYLGGAISAYVRLGEPYPVLVPLSTALLAWAGIYLREERLRSLLPFRRNAAH
jgi:DoxX-like family